MQNSDMQINHRRAETGVPQGTRQGAIHLYMVTLEFWDVMSNLSKCRGTCGDQGTVAKFFVSFAI